MPSEFVSVTSRPWTRSENLDRALCAISAILAVAGVAWLAMFVVCAATTNNNEITHAVWCEW